LALALVAAAQISWAQTPPKKKKKAADPPPAATADVSVAETPPPEPAPPVVSVAVTTPADVASKKATDAAIASNPTDDSSKGTETDVFEKAGEKYYFIGLRYRGTIIPKAFENIFVDGGATIYSNSLGVELDLRKDNFSLIPAISYTSYNTGDILFLQKNKADIPGNWSLVNSSLSAIYLTADLLWTVKLATTVDFEWGAGFGLGFLFGNLENNWVTDQGITANTPGALPGGNGNYYVACATTTSGNGCAPGDHTSPTPAKVGHYNEPFWTGGGSVPNVFPYISIPQVGLRFKPIKQLEGRFGVGFSITGVWLGLSADYGFETPEKK
jgi:hypothetical protein